MNKHNDIKKNILEEIEKGHVSMKPKYYFALKTLALAAGLLIVALVTLFLFSVLLFTAKGSGLVYFSEFGARGIFEFILSAPWLLIILTLILVGLLELMARHFAFIYRKPIVYSVLGILILVTFTGSVIAATPVHKKLHDRAYAIPVTKHLYDRYGDPRKLRGGHVGVIETIDAGGLTLKTYRGNYIYVSTTTKTRGLDYIEIGEHVMVAGRDVDGVFEVYGIKDFDLDRLPFTIERHGPHGATIKMKREEMK